MFKQNQIILISSRLIAFWCFGLPAALGVRGWVYGGGCGVSLTHAHGKHDNFMQMATPIGFGEIPGIPYDVIYACGHACMWMGYTLSPPPPPRGTPRIIQNSIALELIKIF